jgi:hypothetical protein
MKKIINVFLYFLVKLIQVSLMIGMIVLQNLTHKSAGVNHHLYYKKVQYNSKYFTDINVLSTKIIIILLMIFILIFLFKNINKLNKLQKNETVLIILWLLLILITFSLSYFSKLLVYPYLLFTEFISLSLEFIIWLIFIQKYRNG